MFNILAFYQKIVKNSKSKSNSIYISKSNSNSKSNSIYISKYK